MDKGRIFLPYTVRLVKKDSFQRDTVTGLGQLMHTNCSKGNSNRYERKKLFTMVRIKHWNREAMAPQPMKCSNQSPQLLIKLQAGAKQGRWVNSWINATLQPLTPGLTKTQRKHESCMSDLCYNWTDSQMAEVTTIHSKGRKTETFTKSTWPSCRSK